MVQMTDYCILAGISIFFLIECLLHLYENDIFSLETIRKFRILIYFLMVEITIDVAAASLLGKESVYYILYALKYTEFVSNPIIGFLVFEIFYDKKADNQNDTIKQLRKIMITTIIVCAVLPAIPYLWGERIFYIDENNMYQRGNLIILYVLLLFFVIIILTYGITNFFSKTQNIMKQTLFCFMAMLIVGIVLKYFFPYNNYDFLCMSVSIIFLLIYYSHATLRIDPLTQLLNRQVYTKMLEKINYTTIIIMIDANYFKQINDTYGHECGDQTLRQLARAIRKAYGKYAYCFRIGGDEFCIIQKPDAFERLIEKTPHYDAYSVAEKFMERLDEAINARIESNKGKNSCLTYGASQGYGIFYAKADYPSVKERIPLEKVIELADKRMYHNKTLFKKEHPFVDVVESKARAKVLYQPSTSELVDDVE